MVLETAGDEMFFAFCGKGKGCTLDCPVICLGAAARKINLIWVCVQRICQLCTCGGNPLACKVAQRVMAAGVATAIGQCLYHHLHHRRIARGGCGIV